MDNFEHHHQNKLKRERTARTVMFWLIIAAALLAAYLNK